MMEEKPEGSNQQLSMSENEQVELVFLKFGLAQSDQEFEALVMKFLPNILGKVASQDEKIQTKVIQLLNHISSRLKSRSAVKLPISKLLELYRESKSAFVVNFTIIYIKLGFPRLSGKEQAELAPQVFSSLEGKPKSHQDALVRLFIMTIPHIKLSDNPEERSEMFKFQESPSSTKIVLEFCLDVLLMPYSVIDAIEPTSRPSTAPAGAGQGGGQAQRTLTVPPGLSLNAVKRLAGDIPGHTWSVAMIEQYKTGILDLMGGDVFSENDIIIHLIVASSDTRHNVSSKADMELRKRLRSLNWDDNSLVSGLYRLYLGEAQTLTGAQRKQRPSPATLRKSVDLRIKLKIVQNLLRSQSATEKFPYTVQLTYDALFAENTSPRLRVLGLEFVHHICEKCDVSKLQSQAPLLLEAMLKTIQGFASEPRTSGLAYTAMGKLATRVPKLFVANLKLVQDSFEALSKETSQELKLYIQESLAMMSKAYSSIPEDSLLVVEAIITKYITDPDHLCRLSAVRYAGVAFSSDHVPSRYLLLLAASDMKEDVAAEAKKLLYGSDLSGDNTTEENISKSKTRLPKFAVLLKHVHAKAQERLKSSQRFLVGTQSIAFAPSTFLVLLKYSRRCLLNDAVELMPEASRTMRDSFSEAPVIAKYLGMKYASDKEEMTSLISEYLELIMQYTKTITDSDAVYILLETLAVCPDEIPLGTLLSKDASTEDFEKKLEWIKGLIYHIRETIREYGAELYSIVLRKMPPTDVDQEQITKELFDNVQSDKNYERKHGSILALGYLLGEWLPTDGEMVPEVMKSAIFCIVKQTMSRDVAIASASCSAIGEIARKAPLPFRDEEIWQEFGSKEKDEPELVLRTFTLKDLVGRFVNYIKSSTAHKLREKSVMALGCLPVGDPNFKHKEQLLNSLLKSAEIKEADLHFTVARAMCNITLGPRSSVARNHWRPKTEVANETAQSCDEQLSWLIEKILEEYVQHRIPAARQAASIWLLTMIKTEEITSHPALEAYLQNIQSAFMSLLAESDDLVQDVASKGLGVVYELGTDEQKKLLVDALVGSLMEGNAANSAKPKDQENIFHGVRGLGKAPDGSKLTTYKEICSLASDLNQPDLVYKFLHLAKHHALWNSKKGAAFGFSNIASLATEQLTPHLPRIVPRLYRYTFDPQAAVRSAMTSIWNSLAPDPKKLVDNYLELICEDLKKNLSSSLWRTREASCLAVADLLRGGRGLKGGKEGDVVISALPELWTATLRVMDDIKETVREAATAAANSLKKSTIKLCEHDQGKLGEKAVANILPVILKEGLSSKVKEVRALSLSTLVEVGKKSGKVIKGCIPAMVIALLEALSDFEPAELNYLAVRSDKNSREVIDAARAEAAKSSPMVETINRVLQYADKESLEQLIPLLTDVAKRNYGIMTKAGCSHVIISLVAHCPNEVAPFATTIMNSFTSGLTDNSIAVRKCNAEAIGHLAKLAKDSTVSKLFSRLKGWYLEKEDDIHKHASAVGCHAVGKHSPDVIRAHATVTLPLAFLGMHETLPDHKEKNESYSDSSRKVDKNSPRFLWADLWNEFTPGTASAIKLYLDELIMFTSTALQSSQWKMKAQAAATMATIARQQREGTIIGVQLHKLVEILLLGLQGRTWDGKAKLLTALCAVAVHCKEHLTVEEISKILSIFFKECKKEKVQYKTEAIHGLGAILEVHKIDKFSLFWDMLHPILRKDSKDESDSSDNDDEANKKNRSPAKLALLENAIEACGRSWPHNVETQDRHFHEVSKLLAEHITLSTWNIQLAALRSTKAIFRILTPPKQENMEADQLKDNETKGERLLDIKDTGLLDAVCLSLANVKYSRIREEALALVKLSFELFSAGVIRKEGTSQLIQALKDSPLSDKRSSKKANVDELIKKLTSLQ